MTIFDPISENTMLSPFGHAIGSPFGQSHFPFGGGVGCVPVNAFSPGRVPPLLFQLCGERNTTFTDAGV